MDSWSMPVCWERSSGSLSGLLKVEISPLMDSWSVKEAVSWLMELESMFIFSRVLVRNSSSFPSSSPIKENSWLLCWLKSFPALLRRLDDESSSASWAEILKKSFYSTLSLLCSLFYLVYLMLVRTVWMK